MEDHPYCALEPPKRPSPSAELKRVAARQRRERRRQKSRVNIGVAFPRWRALMQDKCFQSDAEVACYLLDRVCGEHLYAAQRYERRLEKSTHVPAPQTEEPESDSSHSSEDHQSSGEEMKVPEICHEVLLPCERDAAVQTKLKSEDQLKSDDQLHDLHDCKDSVFPTLHNGNIVPQCSTSHSTTEVKEEPVETGLQPESRLEVSTSPVATSDKIDDSFVHTPNPVIVDNRIGHKEMPKKSHLLTLFPTCLQCGGPVLEYTTVSFGNQNRLQWKCSKGHLMWLFPNSNPT